MSERKRNLWMCLGAVMVAALFTFGCGGDDNGGLSASDMARIDAAEANAAAAQTAAAEAEAKAKAAAEELAALQTQLEEAEPEADTSDLDAAIALLTEQIAALTAKTADPMTPPEILGGAKSKLTVADVAALGTKIAGELNDAPASSAVVPDVNLPPRTPVDRAGKLISKRERTSHVAAVMDYSNESNKAGTFLTHTFKGTETSVDLASMADVETLALKRLLKVDGVEIFGFTVKETDKMMTQDTGELGVVVVATGTITNDHTTTTTLGADGSESIIVTDPATGLTKYSKTTTYVGGAKIEEYNPVVNAAMTDIGEGVPTDVGAVVTLSDGRTVTYALVAGTDETPASFDMSPTPVTPTDDDNDPILTAHANAEALAAALRKYAAAKAPTYTTPDHSASGYGGWLSDSFFAAYSIMADTEMVYKVLAGARTMDTSSASSLSGRGGTAMWKGLMVGHDLDANKGATYGDILKGNASITAYLGPETVSQPSGVQPDTARLVDVMLDNIINATGKDARVTELSWTNLNLSGGAFGKGSEISGQFYDNGDEVVGRFNKSDIFGAFGAAEYEMPEMMDAPSMTAVQ